MKSDSTRLLFSQGLIKRSVDGRNGLRSYASATEGFEMTNVALVLVKKLFDH
jgi:hypothetical protein